MECSIQKEKAEELERENGFTFVEDSGRGYRKVVPSPKPLHIVWNWCY